MSAHTPGPWLYRPTRHDDWGVVRAEDRTFIAAAHAFVSEAEETEHRRNGTDPYEANARLIAAAPDLLAALRRAVDVIRAFHGIGLNGPAEAGVWELYQHSPEMQAINAAIAKAEGQS